jgi:hypothetical protein
MKYFNWGAYHDSWPRGSDEVYDGGKGESQTPSCGVGGGGVEAVLTAPYIN